MIKKILVIRLSSMGDVVLTTSMIRQIRNKYPDAELDFITSKPFAEIYEYNPWISKLIVYNKADELQKVVKLKKRLKSEIGGRYDVVIDLQRNLRSMLLRSGLGNKYLLVHKRRFHKLSLIYLKRPLLIGIVPIPEIYRTCASLLGIENDGKGLEIWLSEERNSGFYPPDSREVRKLRGKLRIAIAPGAYHATKRLPIQKFIEIINEINSKFDAEIVLIGGIKDKSITDEIKNNLNFHVEDKSNSESILETTMEIDKCSLLISNDTGVVHIASARKIPVALIYGSTVKELGFIPYKTDYRIIEKDVSCRPCTHIGLDKCPRLHFDCMNTISVYDVIKAVEELINF